MPEKDNIKLSENDVGKMVDAIENLVAIVKIVYDTSKRFGFSDNQAMQFAVAWFMKFLPG